MAVIFLCLEHISTKNKAKRWDAHVQNGLKFMSDTILKNESWVTTPFYNWIFRFRIRKVTVWSLFFRADMWTRPKVETYQLALLLQRHEEHMTDIQKLATSIKGTEDYLWVYHQLHQNDTQAELLNIIQLQFVVWISPSNKSTLPNIQLSRWLPWRLIYLIIKLLPKYCTNISIHRCKIRT